MYVCGPTVYSYAHIGNARPVIVFDVLSRVLRRRYANVVYVRNITDIDDKINAAAKKEGVDIRVISDRYAAIYHDDMAALGARDPDHTPRSDEHTSEPQSLMRISYAVLCLKKNKKNPEYILLQIHLNETRQSATSLDTVIHMHT